MDLLSGIVGQVINVMRYALMVGIVIRGYLLVIKIKNGANNPNMLFSAKSEAVLLTIGLVLLVNFWTVYGWVIKFISDIQI